MTIPQGLLDALTATQTSKDAADAANAAKLAADATVTSSQSSAAAAAQDLATKTADLNAKRTQLEAVLDSYFQVGAQPPSPPSPPLSSLIHHSS